MVFLNLKFLSYISSMKTNQLLNDCERAHFDNASHALAPVQRQTLEYLRNFIAENGFAPTLKDIANFIGVKSPSTAHFHLARLEDKGFIQRTEDGGFILIENTSIAPAFGPTAVPLCGLIAAGHPIECDHSVS